MATVAEIRELLAPLKEEITAANKKIDMTHETVTSYIEENRAMAKRCDKLEQELEIKNRQIENLERKLREKNIVIFGIDEEEAIENLEQKVIKIFKENLKFTNATDNHIEDVRRIGRRTADNKRRPILVELISKKIKKEILTNTGHLKRSKVSIEDDYSPKIVQERRILKKHLTQMRRRGESAILKYNKLIINGSAYGVDQLEQQGDPCMEQQTETPEIYGRRNNSTDSAWIESDMNCLNSNVKVDEQLPREQRNKPVTKQRKAETISNTRKKTMNSLQQREGPMDKHLTPYLRSQVNPKN